MDTQMDTMGHTSVRATMAAARAAQRASEWKTGDPHYKPAWNDGNLNKINMEKARPPPPMAPPKAPVPTLAEINFKPESSMRCFHPGLKSLLVDDGESPKRRASHTSRENSTSFVSRRSESGARSKSGDSSPSKSISGEQTSQSVLKLGGTLGMAGDKMSATLRKKQLMEQRHKELNDKRILAMRETMRKKKEKKDEDFTKMYQTLKEEKQTFVHDLTKYLDNKARAAEQKRKALHTEWTECVFNKIQDQLLDRIDTMEEEEIAERRRKLFQNYIDAAARKGGGLFLDIVIENEYDPFTWKKDTLKYRAKPATVSNGPGFTDRFGNPVHDPVKRDLEKLKSEAVAAQSVGGGPGFGDMSGGKIGRDTLSHEHWSKMEATPFFDRAAKVMDAVASGKAPPVRKGQVTTLDINDYQYPSGPGVTTRELQGMYGKGKRTFSDWVPGRPLAAAPAAPKQQQQQEVLAVADAAA